MTSGLPKQLREQAGWDRDNTGPLLDAAREIEEYEVALSHVRAYAEPLGALLAEMVNNVEFIAHDPDDTNCVHLGMARSYALKWLADARAALAKNPNPAPVPDGALVDMPDGSRMYAMGPCADEEEPERFEINHSAVELQSNSYALCQLDDETQGTDCPKAAALKAKLLQVGTPSCPTCTAINAALRPGWTEELAGAMLRHAANHQPPSEGNESPEGWKRDDEATRDLLSLVDVDVSLEEIGMWSDSMVRYAEDWAEAVHLRASDNDDVKVPRRPNWLPKAECVHAICKEVKP